MKMNKTVKFHLPLTQLTDMLRVRKAAREAPKTNLLDRIKSLEKQNQVSFVLFHIGYVQSYP